MSHHAVSNSHPRSQDCCDLPIDLSMVTELVLRVICNHRFWNKTDYLSNWFIGSGSPVQGNPKEVAELAKLVYLEQQTSSWSSCSSQIEGWSRTWPCYGLNYPHWVRAHSDWNLKPHSKNKLRYECRKESLHSPFIWYFGVYVNRMIFYVPSKAWPFSSFQNNKYH